MVLLTPGLFSSSWNAISYDLELEAGSFPPRVCPQPASDQPGHGEVLHGVIELR